SSVGVTAEAKYVEAPGHAQQPVVFSGRRTHGDRPRPVGLAHALVGLLQQLRPVVFEWHGDLGDLSLAIVAARISHRAVFVRWWHGCVYHTLYSYKVDHLPILPHYAPTHGDHHSLVPLN